MENTASLRQAYGKALVRVGRMYPEIIALDADLGKSTFSRSITELGKERYVEVGIAEQNMASLSAGMAFAGKIPFFSSFAVFSTGRAYDQIRSSICIPNINVNICGSSAGLSDYGDGKTHQSIDDIALMRILPNMTVLAPVDANQVDGMVEAMAKNKGPCYIRIPRNELPIITEKETYKIGQIDVLKECGDVALMATGGAVHNALEAAKTLDSLGIKAGVLNIGTIKPFPTKELQSITKHVKAVVIIEEHNVIGGLGSAVMCALAGQSIKFAHLGMEETFGQSAENYELLLKHYGLTVTDIVKRTKAVLS